MADELLVLDGVVKNFSRSGLFRSSRTLVQAVRGVDLEIEAGKTVGLVGESGCGKSTLGHLCLRLMRPDAGKILFSGVDIASLGGRGLRFLRKEMQIIFQDPYASLNPRMRVGEIVEEPLLVHGFGDRHARRDRAMELLMMVGLSEADFFKYPHQFSGGQRQRICIARAIAVMPKFIVADEPVSALDVSVQGGIVNLLCDLQRDYGISYLFITHDLSLVRYVSHKIAVMYLGKIVEVVESSRLLNALHPYTLALLSAVPKVLFKGSMRRIVLKGDVPSPICPPSGCSFHPRCIYHDKLCVKKEPILVQTSCDDGLHLVACHHVERVLNNR